MIAFLADGLLFVLMAVAGISLLFGTSSGTKRSGYPYLLMAGLTSLLVGKLLSLIYQPTSERPFLELGMKPGAAYIDNPGFPSDHVLLATIIALSVIFFVRKRWLSVLMVTLVLGISVGRVLALVHTPLDVIGGLVAGLSGGPWYLMLTRTKER